MILKYYIKFDYFYSIIYIIKTFNIKILWLLKKKTKLRLSAICSLK